MLVNWNSMSDQSGDTQQQQDQQQGQPSQQQQEQQQQQQDPTKSQTLPSNEPTVDIRSLSLKAITQSKGYCFLPSIQLQYDWHIYQNSDSDCFWVNLVKDSKSTVHATVSTKKTSNNTFQFDVIPENTLTIKPINGNGSHLALKYGQHNQEVIAPSKIHKVAGTKRITSMGASSEGGLCAYGSSDGILEIFESDDGQVRRKLRGHVGDVDVSKFFPSGRVLLSGASDARLRIWDAIEGECAMTLTSHTAGITSASFVERGRNFISTSRDGSAKLWDVPTGTVIHTLQNYDRPINDCYVTTTTIRSSQTLDEREFGTDGKVVLLALEQGSLILNDIRSANIVAEMSEEHHSTAFNACFALNNYVYGGDDDGFIFQYDRRKLDQPTTICQFSNSPIHHIRSNNDDPLNNHNSLWVSSGDGNIFLVDFDSQSVTRSLSGIDTDVVTSLNVVPGSKKAFATSRDAYVRVYDL
ncbi:hypothetical protein SAMD00019534_007450 [Acytostelium subglobosum LB1]|uniref:hypothetical protein n=1 Tax=Acytostelium subglobosum LB1 TaxID=1410327 RepID=UPI000644AC1E|nr:hypothetical protein SAMD00019534_007450 [Acytostelium subglobosum LB1]GAM17570.1 hypothetical protein SAMD00019534_007450 [Acytostelium subglobosum LB1]|eukprot:XP_012759632.1 hypothetical protein SAMD00019534_007450 [Acytostelium subglobosum LB1]